MATPGQQAAQALRSGGVRRMADTNPQDDGIVPAGAVSKLFEKLVRKSVQNPAPGSVTQGKRVPEPSVAQVLPEGQTTEKIQSELAPNVLSPEGLERFQSRGQDARSAIAKPTEREIMGGKLEPTFDDLRSATDADEVTKKAKLATSGLQTVRESESAIASFGDADDLIRMATEPGLVDDTTGIDFNFDNFEGGEDINRVINGVSEIIANPIEAEKRGIITNQETLDSAFDLMADEMKFSKELLKKQSGKLLNAAEMTAARILLQKSAGRLKEMAEQIKAGQGSPKLLVEFRRQMSIHAGIQMKAKGAQTEIARALQAFKIPAGAQVPQEALEALLNESGGSKLAEKMAKGYLDALEEGGQANANNYVAGAALQKVSDVWMEVYINGLLSYFPTHLKNGLATPLFMVYNTFADLTGAAYGSAFRTGAKAFNKEVDVEGLYFEDVFARVLGMTKAFGDALAVAGKTFRDETPADALNKLEAGTLRAIDSERLNITKPGMAEAVDRLGRLIRLPGRFLMMADDFWKTIGGRGALYEEAVRQARRSKANGRTDKEAMDDGMMVLLDPKFAADEIDAESRYITMTTDLGDSFVGTSTNLLRRSFLGKLIMPFAKAPTNSMLRVAEGHPLMQIVGFGLSSKSRNNLLGRNGAKAQQRALGRLSLGGGTMYYFHQKAINGELTGSYPRDKQLQRMLPPKWQPYSLVFRDEGFPVDEEGDPLPLYNKETGLPNGPLKYISYQGLEPVSAFLGIAASTARYQTFFYDPEDKQNLLSAATLATYDYFRDMPMIQGIGSIARAFEYGDPSIITDGFMGGTALALPMPYSSAVRNIEKLRNNEKRTVEASYQYYTLEDVQRLFEEAKDTDVPFKEVPYDLIGTVKNPQDASWSKFFNDQFIVNWERQMQNVPYVNEKVQNFAYQYDMLGNKKEIGISFDINPVEAIWNNVTPFKISRGGEVDQYLAEIIRLGAPLKESRDIKTIDGYKLDPRQRGELTNIAKNEIALPVTVKGSRRGPTRLRFREYLKAVMLDPLFISADDDTKIGIIQNAEAKFYKEALPIMLSRPGNQDLATVREDRQAVETLFRQKGK